LMIITDRTGHQTINQENYNHYNTLVFHCSFFVL
jgi:hypothetical protein